LDKTVITFFTLTFYCINIFFIWSRFGLDSLFLAFSNTKILKLIDNCCLPWWSWSWRRRWWDILWLWCRSTIEPCIKTIFHLISIWISFNVIIIFGHRILLFFKMTVRDSLARFRVISFNFRLYMIPSLSFILWQLLHWRFPIWS